MDLKARILAETKDAMKARDSERLSTLRLISAAIKDREIAARGSDGDDGPSEGDLLALLGKMVKQRQESARAYQDGGRDELAQKELAEIEVIRHFLPRQMDEAEIEAALDKVLADLGASSIRDMGRVMGELKTRYEGQMDFGAVGARLKSRLM
ncbi:MAG: GatB/YqeY domain-containing protein [Paracoccus sp. (in: a-proteobacteria)]|nr:GatB/YqeY domain-containing protein [Paracoccus sp. (in: a-proteobacteria)]